MGQLIEMGRYALESFEVLFAAATAGLLTVGLIHARQSESAHRDPAATLHVAETQPE